MVSETFLAVVTAVVVVFVQGTALLCDFLYLSSLFLYVGGNCSRVLVAHHSKERCEYIHSATAFQRSAVVMLCVLIVCKQSCKYIFLTFS
jgi:hypothetical protein